MYFAVISIFPEMFATIRDFGITARAVTQEKITIECINPRDYTTDNYRRIDERPYGGGPGMVMMAEPLSQAIEDARLRASQHGCRMDAAYCPVIYMSPQGQTLSESSVVDMTEYDVDMEVSLGDYVLTGGELPAMVLMDSVIRRLPDIMGDDKSAEQDSFVDGLLDCPHYTKPHEFAGMAVPEVLLSGHHANIAQWRFAQQVERTQMRRPDLWQAFIPTMQQAKWLKALAKK